MSAPRNKQKATSQQHGMKVFAFKRKCAVANACLLLGCWAGCAGAVRLAWMMMVMMMMMGDGDTVVVCFFFVGMNFGTESLCSFRERRAYEDALRT